MDLVTKQHVVLDEQEERTIKSYLERLLKKEPIQYVVGETEFCDLKIGLTSNVLIPRPETEEIVISIKNELENSELRILDIGTGSGCIALALKHFLPNSLVYGCDISEGALKVAKDNALRNMLDVDFVILDILQAKKHPAEPLDVIVSNPPYVRESEAAQMSANVLDFEPHLALFVPDSDPLLFYSAIVRFALSNLKIGGKLYFEINEALGAEVKLLMEANHFRGVEICNDLEGKERLVKGVLNNG